jgi:hypothetical protein
MCTNTHFSQVHDMTDFQYIHTSYDNEHPSKSLGTCISRMEQLRIVNFKGLPKNQSSSLVTVLNVPRESTKRSIIRQQDAIAGLGPVPQSGSLRQRIT